jgi:hypothetical protein
VERFGVSRRELASVVAEQWAKLGGSAGPEDTASWRRLGEIFVERGFVSQGELDQALMRQRQTGERLGEALVAQGVISKFELAGALAEQMAALGESDRESNGPVEPATVHELPARDEPDAAAAIPPDNVVEFTPPKDAVVEQAPDTAAWLREMEHDGRVGASRGAAGLQATRREPQAEAATGRAPGGSWRRSPSGAAGDPSVSCPPPTCSACRRRRGSRCGASSRRLEVGQAEPVPPEGSEGGGLRGGAVEVLQAEAAEPVAWGFGGGVSEVGPRGAPGGGGQAVRSGVRGGVSEVGAVEIPRAELPAADVFDAGRRSLGWGGPRRSRRRRLSRSRPGVRRQVSEVGTVEMPREEQFAVDPLRSPRSPVEPAPVDEPVELARPRALSPPRCSLTDLRDAIAGGPPTPTRLPTRLRRIPIAFAPTTDGYRLIALEALPEPGETIDVPEIGARVVLRVGRSPIPADARLCAYVEETVTAPVGLAVH